MNAETFIARIEATYGDYKPGMQQTVQQKIRGASAEALADLFNAIADTYERNTPPNAAQVRRIAAEHGVSLAVTGREFVAVCKECANEYPLDMYDCPHCGIGNPAEVDPERGSVALKGRTVRRRA